MADEPNRPDDRDAHLQVGPRIATAPRVSICVLALGSVDRLDRCLASMRSHVDLSVAEVIVVANQMSPAQASRISRRDDIVLLVSETNLGFGGGNNYAASCARGEYLVFLNDDSIVEPGWLENLLQTADADESFGAVGSKIVSPDGSLQEAGSVLWRDGLASHIGEGQPGTSLRFQYRRDVDYMSANGLLVRRAAWDVAGGFDDRFHPAYYEDVDLCMALRANGYRVVYEPRAVIRHDASQSTTNLFRRYLLDRNRRQCLEKWRDEMSLFEPLAGGKRRAIDRSIRRARGYPATLLVVVERLEDPGTEPSPLWTAIEDLARAQWAITVVLTKMSSGDLPFGPARTTAMDQLVEWGVEVFPGALASFWGENVTPFDAVLVGDAIGRADWQADSGQPSPTPIFVEPGAWVDVATSLRPPRTPTLAGSSDGAVTRTRATETASVALGLPQGPSPASRLERGVHAAQSELAVKNAYIAKLEHDVESMTADRARLPQTRAKRQLQRLVGRDHWAALAAQARPGGGGHGASAGHDPTKGSAQGAAHGSSSPVPSTAGDLTEPWLIVMGMHRSGTSAVAGALGRLGMSLPAEDDWLDPDESNPDHFESRSMMLLDERLLRAYGGSWDSPPQLPAGWSASSSARALDGEARDAIAWAFPHGGPVVFKDPRACMCLPFWERVVNVPMAAVFVWRSPLAVARSLEKRNGFDPLLGAALWERYNAAALETMEGMDVFVTRYERVLADPGASCRAISKWLDTLEPWQRLGRTWQVDDAATAFISDRQHQYDEDVSLLLDSQRQLLEVLGNLEGPYAPFETPAIPSPSPWATALVEAHHFENVAERARREADGMRGSVSWRVTAPIRMASSRARPRRPG